MTDPGRQSYAFGGYVINVANRELLADGREVEIQHRVFDLLVYLVENCDRAVSKDELLERVWAGRITTDAALARVVMKARKAVGDDANTQEVIKTLHGHGYRFVAPVTSVALPNGTIPDEPGNFPVDRFEHGSGRGLSAWLTGKSAGRIILALLAVALIYFAFDQFIPQLIRDDIQDELARQSGVEPVSENFLPAGFGEKSVAVLPFVNRSMRADDLFFTDGMQDELLSRLSQIHDLKVISRTSVEQYRDTEKTVPQIAQELSVSNLLEGAVQRAGNDVRITVQLIKADGERHLWAETFDRELTTANLFAIQSEIVEKIAESLETTLSPTELGQVRSQPTDNFAAYEAYLIGRQRLTRRTTQSLAESAEYFREAKRLDPQFILAYAGLSDALQLLHFYSGSTTGEMLEEAGTILDEAIEMDENSSEVYASLGLFKMNDGDLEGADLAFNRALELNPNYANAHFRHSTVLYYQGKHIEAQASLEKALTLDPMSTVIRGRVAQTLRRSGQFDRAKSELDKILEIDPTSINAHVDLAIMQYSVFNQYDIAVEGFRKAISLDPGRTDPHLWLGEIYLQLDLAARAEMHYEKVLELVSNDYEEVLGFRLWLEMYRGDLSAASETARQFMSIIGRSTVFNQFAVAQIRNQELAAGRFSAALALYNEFYQSLIEDEEPEVNALTFMAAIDLAPVLRHMGNHDRAELLLDRAWAYIYDRPRLDAQFGTGIADVQILALQGRHNEALNLLQEAVDEGWRYQWWYYLLMDPNLDSLRDLPSFNAVVDYIRADLSDQLLRAEALDLTDR